MSFGCIFRTIRWEFQENLMISMSQRLENTCSMNYLQRPRTTARCRWQFHSFFPQIDKSPYSQLQPSKIVIHPMLVIRGVHQRYEKGKSTFSDLGKNEKKSLIKNGKINLSVQIFLINGIATEEKKFNLNCYYIELKTKT